MHPSLCPEGSFALFYGHPFTHHTPALLSSAVLQLLERCSWRVVLREDGEELLAAQLELEASPAFHSTCATIAQWAEDGRVPLQVGGLGRSKAGATGGDSAQRVLGPHNQ